jgi:predicted glycosyltransferase
MGQHILLATEANEGLGHIAPWKALIEQLLGQGDRVTFACPQPDLAKSVLNLSGVNYQPILWPSMHVGPTPVVSQSWAQLLGSLGYASAKAVSACLQRWLQLLRDTQPDCVIADYAPLGMLAAKALQVPLIEAGGGFCLPPAADVAGLVLPTAHTLTKPEQAEVLISAQRSAHQVVQAFNSALQSQALSMRLDTLAQLYQLADHRCIVSSALLDPYFVAGIHNRHAVHIGPLAHAHTGRPVQESAPAWAHAPSSQLRVLCYLKPSTQDLAHILEAMHHWPDCQLLIAGHTPPSLQPTPTLMPQPSAAHIHLANSAIDFASAMPLADVFITNGGLHSLSWALENHCHCILLPAQAEQAATALRLAQHPQVSVCMQTASLSASMATMHKKSNLVQPYSALTGSAAEQKLIAILRDGLTQDNARVPVGAMA